MNVELHWVWGETGTTVPLVTHLIAERVYLANRVVVLTLTTSPRWPGRSSRRRWARIRYLLIAVTGHD
jgi:NitT/TauT family transport system ATP-binding protein